MNQPGRVLIVDDKPQSQRIVADLVRRLGHQPHLASGGRSAVEMIDVETYDLVLLDVRTADLDGYGVLAHLRAKGKIPGLLVLVITPETDRQARLDAIAGGATDHILTPIDPRELEARVNSLVELARLRRVDARNTLLEHEVSAFANLRATLQHLPLCAYQGTLDGDLVAPEWLIGDVERLLGVSETTIKADPHLFNRARADYRPAVAAVMREVASGTRATWSLRYRVANSDRNDPWIHDVGTYDRARGRVIGTLFDVDAEVRLEDELATSARREAMASRAGARMTDMVDGVLSLAARMAGGRRSDPSGSRVVGSYRLGARLGEGRGSEVYMATHVLLSRLCAIKMIRLDSVGDEDAQQEALERFHREARVTAQLQSPHTITVHDFGASDGDLYFVMELADGLDLRRLIAKSGRIPAARAIPILVQACDSLGEAHELGLVHRDIKPENIMLCRHRRRFDVTKVLDFGVVRHGHTDGEGNTRMLGTPAFMAPEIGGGTEIDGRADLYSLGCVAYWLLTGRLVFEHKDPRALMVAHSTQEPTRPSVHAPVPPALDDLVMACLSKDPADRPASATDLARRLGAVPIEARWTARHAELWWQRHLPPMG